MAVSKNTVNKLCFDRPSYLDFFSFKLFYNRIFCIDFLELKIAGLSESKN